MFYNIYFNFIGAVSILKGFCNVKLADVFILRIPLNSEIQIYSMGSGLNFGVLKTLFRE